MNLFLVLPSSALADQFISVRGSRYQKPRPFRDEIIRRKFGFNLKPRLLYTTCFIHLFNTFHSILIYVETNLCFTTGLSFPDPSRRLVFNKPNDKQKL